MPLDSALSILEVAAIRADLAASLSPAAIAASTFLIDVLTADFSA